MTELCEAASMKMTSLADAPEYDSERFVAGPLLDGTQSNVRVIRLSPGQALPSHTHGTSDLMIYIVEGSGTLDVDGAEVAFVAGSLAFFHGDEELRLANPGTIGLTALAFLAPPFPPPSS
jgi:quercetin dioxygenase-like cupin family protein